MSAFSNMTASSNVIRREPVYKRRVMSTEYNSKRPCAISQKHEEDRAVIRASSGMSDTYAAAQFDQCHGEEDGFECKGDEPSACNRL